MESDHKPLLPLLNMKHLDDLPPRMLRFWLRLAKYDYVAHHIPGKLLYAADALSHAPSREEGDQELQEEVEAMSTMSLCLPYQQHLRGFRFISWLKLKFLNA